MSSFMEIGKKGRGEIPKRDSCIVDRDVSKEDMLLWRNYILITKCNIPIDKVINLPRDRDGKKFIPDRTLDFLVDFYVTEQKIKYGSIEEEDHGSTLGDPDKLKISL